MQIDPAGIDADAAKVIQRLRRYDHAAYLVGGCVRDLMLGRKPKDFDVVTSATPNDIRRLFKNCRIIGRRFRLAHIFFGPKIIETSTFRANPREIEEEEGGGESSETESGDLLIRRDNIFGTPEQDARRRDFTINGLFYDIETKEVIDHVNGTPDLEARVVRTIGDPDIRFREDPVRILRAVKFAARCDLTIEPETYRFMMEHRLEIAKCAQARVSEEFYRLLRSGAAKRSMELLLETELLEILAPELVRGLKPDADASEEAALHRARFWGYLAALDRSSAVRPVPPSNALLLAVLVLPRLRDALDPDSNGVRDIGQMVSQVFTQALDRLRPSRRDTEITRQILIALRNILPAKSGRRKGRPPSREFLDEALRLAEIVSQAEAAETSLAGRPIIAEGVPPVSDAELEAEAEELAVAMEPAPADPYRHRDHGRRGGYGRDGGRDGGGRNGARDGGGREGGGRDGGQRPGRNGLAPAPASPPMDLGALAAAARSLVTPIRPTFLGTGTFGGPWSSRAD